MIDMHKEKRKIKFERVERKNGEKGVRYIYNSNRFTRCKR